MSEFYQISAPHLRNSNIGFLTDNKKLLPDGEELFYLGSSKGKKATKVVEKISWRKIKKPGKEVMMVAPGKMSARDVYIVV